MSQESIWVSWEDHRRSRELSNALGVDFYPLISESPRWKRYPVLLFKTIILLLKKRPTTVFVQNPSIVLTSAVVFLKGIFRYIVIVDRHSNFKFEHESSKSLKWRLFHFLSRYTLKNADLTVVTNEHLKQICEKIGGRSVVLQDRIPNMNRLCGEVAPSFIDFSKDLFHVMAVTTFNEDEPIYEIIEAAKMLHSRYRVYFTGNYRKMFTDADRDIFERFGIIFTGFIDEGSYKGLMWESDAVLVLTKKEHILNCGAYEAIALKKPMVLSDTNAIRNYFNFGAVYSNCSSEDIYKCLLDLENSTTVLLAQFPNGEILMRKKWEVNFSNLLYNLKSLNVGIGINQK